MLLTGNRHKEVQVRSKYRQVTAIIHMLGPEQDVAGIKPDQMGMIVEDRKPSLSILALRAFAQGAHFWQQDDTCEPKIEKDPAVMAEIYTAIEKRTKAVNRGEITDHDAQKAAFDSLDLINKATGIPPHITIKFNDSVIETQKAISAVPFAKLQGYLFILQEKLEAIGGRLYSTDIAHVPSMSAFEYYEQGLTTTIPGKKFGYGDVMVAKAYNLLGEMGMPLVAAPRPRLH